MAKIKRPEQKVMYDVAGLFLILYLLKEMAKVLAPAWKDGIYYMTIGCILCLVVIGGVLFYLFIWMDGTARKLRELFYYYKLEGNNGYPKYLGKSRAQYVWLYGKHVVKAEDKESGDEDVLVSPFCESNSINEFYQNNQIVTRYRFSLPGGLKVAEFGGKLEGMVQHLEREVIIVYEDRKLNIIVGDKTERKFLQTL